MPAITLHEVSKAFPRPDGSRLLVLDRISFDVELGSFTSILGPSGCGKSTILNLIAGLDRDHTGRIDFSGRSGGSDRPAIGFVFQQPRLLNWRTVTDNVLLPLEQGKVGGAARRELAVKYLKLVGLDGYADYHPLQLSAGMQQRVAIARALVIDPDVLLMDEPFGGLDEITARRMRQELVDLWQKTGTTVIFVTHNIREAVVLSEQIVIVSRKPARVHRRVRVDLTYPRQYDDRHVFDVEANLTREFLAIDDERTDFADQR